jgi:hypothetical protein
MAIFNTAYDTLVCSSYRLKDIEDGVLAASIQEGLQGITIDVPGSDNHVTVNMITGGTPMTDVIPYFTHPLWAKSRDGKLGTYLDVRSFVRFERQNSGFKVRNRVELQWQVERAVLGQLWVTGSVNALRDISMLPMTAYSTMLSEVIARKYSLDPGEQLITQVVAAYFYCCLFSDEDEFDEIEYGRMVNKIAMATRAPAKRVFEICDELKPQHNLVEFCEAVKKATGSIRLEDFNEGVLLAISSGNWFGTNARENMAVALEHIPTWLMICYACLSEATFKRSTVAKLVERFGRGPTGDSFVRTMQVMMNSKEIAASIQALSN